jgi:hypothetical protein
MNGARARRLGPFAAAALVFACAKIDNAPEEWTYDGPVNACGAAGDCAAGDCDTEIGTCVVSPPVGDTLFARVVPDPATGAPAQVYTVAVGGGTIADALSVRVPVTVTGDTLVINEDDVTSPLQGRVVFADVGNRLPGQPAQITVYETSSSSVFDLSLLPSTYDIIVFPEDAQALYAPVCYFDDIALDATGVFRDSGGDPMDVVVPLAAATVSGQITLMDAPINDLEVVAFDRATGRILSTADVTACDEVDTGTDTETVCGHFSIGLAKSVVDPAPLPFWLRVSRPSEPRHPVFEAGGGEDEGFTPPAAGEELELIGDERLAFGALGVPVRFQATVLEPVRTASGVDSDDTAPSCFVGFSSIDVACGAATCGAVEKWVLTNEAGEIEETAGIPGVDLYPGDYAITVIPAYAEVGSTGDYAVYTSAEPTAITEDNVAGEVELLLGWRPLVTGVVAAGGIAVPSSAVTAELAVGAPDTARPNSATSGNSGAFRFWLDAAPYVVVAEAPGESRYAWDVVEATVPDQALGLSLELPLPFALRGTVAASAEQVNPIDLAGSVVEWYREIGGRAYPVGRSVADENGGFVALLPL